MVVSKYGETSLPQRSVGWSVAAFGAVASSSQTWRTSSDGERSRDRKRHLLRAAHRLRLALLAPRVPSTSDGVPLLSGLALGWHLAESQRYASEPNSTCCRSSGESQRRRFGQPEHQDDGKGGPRGYDAGKKVAGRKRHIVVDTLGLILAVVVHAANVQDRDGAKLVVSKLKDRFPRLKLIWADGGYAGQLIEWVKQFGNWALEIVKRSDDAKGFVLLPHRWVVERTFAWLGKYRRLSKDYEALPETTETLIYAAMIHLMLRRLKPG